MRNMQQNVSDAKQLVFPLLQTPKAIDKSIWTFDCLCWSCLRITTIPAGLFLQGDPFCDCGSTNITANHEARAFMEKLRRWKQVEPMDYWEKKILSWTPQDGALFLVDMSKATTLTPVQKSV